MKIVCVIVALVMGFVIAAPLMAQGTHYKNMSNDQLYQLQKEGVPRGDRANFEAEWEQRVVTMTPEELRKYQVPYSPQDIQRMREGYRNPQQGGGPVGPGGR